MSGDVKYQDIEYAFRGQLSPQQIRLLCEINERRKALEKTVYELAQMLDQMMGIVAQISDVAGAHHAALTQGMATGKIDQNLGKTADHAGVFVDSEKPEDG